jgi:hypothetical protein
MYVARSIKEIVTKTLSGPLKNSESISSIITISTIIKMGLIRRNKSPILEGFKISQGN